MSTYPYECHNFVDIEKYFDDFLYLLHCLKELGDSLQISQPFL